MTVRTTALVVFVSLVAGAAARSQSPSRIDAIAGCYRVEIGAWSVTGQERGLTPPAEFRLDTAASTSPFAARQADRLALPDIVSHRRAIGMWLPFGLDSVRVIWSTGFQVGGFMLQARADSVSGTAITWTDMRTGQPDPTASARGSRVACGPNGIPVRADSGLRAHSQLFTYDATLPLNARTFERMDSAAFVREKVVFDGGRGSRVPGFVAVPKTAGRHPVVVLVDGIGGWKERWWQPTSWNRGKVLIDSLIKSGFAVAMVDAPASGERTFENDYESAESFIRKPAQWRDMGIRNAIEIRRLLDYLGTRADIDTTRIGILGLSHGGMMTFVLSAIEPRIRAAVAGLTPMQNIPDALLPYHYASSVRIPLLLLAGRTDGWYTQPQVERALAALGSKQKELVWYDVGHRLPETYAEAAARWFRAQLR